MCTWAPFAGGAGATQMTGMAVIPVKPGSGVVPYNPTVDVMYAPLVGPLHPHQKQLVKHNHLAGNRPTHAAKRWRPMNEPRARRHSCGSALRCLRPVRVHRAR